MIYSEANPTHHVTSPTNISEYMSKKKHNPNSTVMPKLKKKLNVQSSTEILSQELKKIIVVLFELGFTQGSHSVFG